MERCELCAEWVPHLDEHLETEHDEASVEEVYP